MMLARSAEAVASPRHHMSTMVSPRGINARTSGLSSEQPGFSRVGNSSKSITKRGQKAVAAAAAAARQRQAHASPVAVEGTEMKDMSPPEIQPLSRARYDFTHGTRQQSAVATSNATPPQGAVEASRRGRSLAEWVWPLKESAASNKMGNDHAGMPGVSPESVEKLQDQGRVFTVEGNGGIGKRSSIVVGKVCEPIRPTKLDLSCAAGGAARTLSSRVLYTAKNGGQNLNLDLPPTPRLPVTPLTVATTTGTSTGKFFGGRPSPIRISAARASIATAPRQDNGRSCNRARSASYGAAPSPAARGGGFGGGFGRDNTIKARGRTARTSLSSSKPFGGLRSPRYTKSTTVSQAKTKEPLGGAGSGRHHRQSYGGTDGGGGGRGGGWGFGGEMWRGKKTTRSRARRRSSSLDEGQRHAAAAAAAAGPDDAADGDSGNHDTNGGDGSGHDDDGSCGPYCTRPLLNTPCNSDSEPSMHLGSEEQAVGGGGGGGGGMPPRSPRAGSWNSSTNPVLDSRDAVTASVHSRRDRMREFSRPHTMRAAISDTASKFFGNKHSGGTKHGGGNKHSGGDKKPSGGKAGGRRPRKAPTDIRRSSGILRATLGLEHDYRRPRGRIDERETLTIYSIGVAKPEGLRLRVVKASGRTLNDTLFHMEIRTLRPGQVWSVCRRYAEFQNLHAALQRSGLPETALPRLPRPPSAGCLEPATLERTRAGLQAYLGALATDVASAWENECFVMFLDSEEKGRRLFARKRKKESRRASYHPRSNTADKPLISAARLSVSSVPFPPTSESDSRQSLPDVQSEEKKLAMAAKEGAAQSHFNGVGAVMNTLVSFSDDDDDCDLGLDDDFIDGEDAIRAMLDRDAEEAEDDNLFTIPAGTDFGALDDDTGDDFDLAYHG